MLFTKKQCLETWKITNPVLLGYIPLSMAFGLLYSEMDMHWAWAVVMSFFVYAGSSQLLVIPLLLDGASLFDIAIVTLLVNIRHIFYGLSLLGKFSHISFFKRNYMILGLTDEAYSILSTSAKASNENSMFLIILFCHFYWVAGTAVGAYVGHLIPYDLTFLCFSLIALFIVLTIDQMNRVKSAKPFVVAALCSVVALLLFPDYMLLASLSFSVIYLGGEYHYAKQ